MSYFRHRSMVSRFRGLDFHDYEINHKSIGDEIFEQFLLLDFGKVTFDVFSRNYIQNILDKYEMFKEIHESNAGKLLLEYASHRQFVALWKPYNLLSVLSSIEDEQYEEPNNLHCFVESKLGDEQGTDDDIANYLVVFECALAEVNIDIYTIKNAIISITEDELQDKKSFANLMIGYATGVSITTREVLSELGETVKKKYALIIVQMTEANFDQIKGWSDYFLNIVVSCYLPMLHQNNLEQLKWKSQFSESFLSPKVSQEVLEIDRNYRTDAKNLNDFQDRAVQTVLKCMKTPDETNIPLILGPPGTGKSHTIVTILENVYQQNPDARVLVCASSNAAVNVLARRVVDKRLLFDTPGAFTTPGPIFVLGNFEKIDSELRHFRPKGRDEPQRMLQSPCLIFSTLNSCQPMQVKGWRSMEFDLVIIDEAGQSTEIETLMPFAYDCHTTVLVGDPGQLQPTVKSQICVNSGYSRSFFERYQKLKDQADDDSTVKLLMQYRMKPEICQFPSDNFYKGKLQTSPGSGENPNLNMDSITCYDLANSREKKEISIVNTMEAAFIVQVIENIFERFFQDLISKQNVEDSSLNENVENPTLNENVENPSPNENVANLIPKWNHVLKGFRPSIGVICFYKAQVELIKTMLKSSDFLKGADINVNTVDSFQGQEKDVIIVSCCRANEESEIGFSNNPKRLNVALTRAKSASILVVNKKTFEQDELWRKLFAFYSEQNRLITLRLRMDIVS